MSKIDFEDMDDLETVDNVEDLDKLDDIDHMDTTDKIDEAESSDDLDEIENIDEVEAEEMDDVWKEKGKKDKNGKGGAFSELISFLLYMGIAIVVTFLIIQFVGQRTVVSGPSMQHTLYNGDNIILDKISYRFHEPERFDIVVFPVETEDKHYIKRIIGLPGETVQIINGFVYVSNEDGQLEQLDESYGSEIMLDMTDGGYLTTSPCKLGENEYYVLGDNRNNSTDSTEIGPISGDIIEGRAWIRIYPFDSIGKLD